jgi:hypothetical protein
MEPKSATQVPGYPDIQAEDIRTRWAWGEPSVWSERMLAALERGYFTELGYYSLVAAHTSAYQSRRETY